MADTWQVVATKKIQTTFIVTNEQWQKALQILVEKPQSVDRRVSGQLSLGRRAWRGSGWPQLASCLASASAPSWDCIEELICDSGTEEDSTASDWSLILQRLVYKKADKLPDHVRLVAMGETDCFFLPVGCTQPYPYRLTLRDSEVCEIQTISGCSEQQEGWLKGRLVERLVSWLADSSLGQIQAPPSLRLVDLQLYTSEYARLKEKYAANLIASWQESSDPEKSVHEDLGIAAYLSCLWQGKATSFVDLGCGNGLLVYILTSEGHRGVGYDLRRRRIWDTYPDTVALHEEPILPHLSTRFPGVDWILGNHSDELTPWIPVMACLSGPHTCYWVLPCCPFSFTAKFRRRQAQLSVFRDYLNFVHEVGQRAGFLVEEDRMRIPSTKRVCFVGRPQNIENSVSNPVITYEERKERLLSFLASQPGLADAHAESVAAFRPRERTERVRNCTQLDRELVSSIVAHVVEMCLNAETDQRQIVGVGGGRSWNAGGELELSYVAEELAVAGWDLSQLKAECGGLQTLFRNHHAIFSVRGGHVRLRIPGEEKVGGNRKITGIKKDAGSREKSKICWHHANHPDGCPLTSDTCSWLHSDN